VDLRETSREEAKAMKTRIMAEQKKVIVVAGSLRNIINVAEADWQKIERKKVAQDKKNAPGPARPPTPNKEVMVFWGDGTWSRTQLIGEIARGGWGMCAMNVADIYQVPGLDPPPKPSDLWRAIQDEGRPLEAGQNDMMRNHEINYAAEARAEVDTPEAAEHRKRLREQLMKQQQKKSRNNPPEEQMSSKPPSETKNSEPITSKPPSDPAPSSLVVEDPSSQMSPPAAESESSIEPTSIAMSSVEPSASLPVTSAVPSNFSAAMDADLEI